MRAEEIARLLPAVFQQGLRRDGDEPGVLDAMLEVMELAHAPADATLAALDQEFDPWRASERFVPLLAGWLGLGPLLRDTGEAPATIPPGSGRLRLLVHHAAELASRRGTKPGLSTFLELATGCGSFVIHEGVSGVDLRPRPFHLRVIAPPAAAAYRGFVEAILEREKPAYVTYEIAFETTGEQP